MSGEVKELVLKDVLKFLDHISNNIGEITNEYAWRESCSLITLIEEVFNVSIRFSAEEMEEMNAKRNMDI